MENIIMDFSGMYAEEGFGTTVQNASYIDLKAIGGTNCYCDSLAASAVRDAIRPFPTRSVHWIDTGDYHYVTRFWLERVAREREEKPFALVLFDHHPDMQEPAFEGVVSCGGWARDAFTGLDGLRQALLIGINPDLELEILDLVFDGVMSVTTDDLRHTGDALGRDAMEMLSLLEPGIPVYVSIDLDVLKEEYAATDWDQGVMTLAQLKSALESVAFSHEILGVDICGGLTRGKGAKDDDLELNVRTRLSLSAFVDNLLER